MIKNILTLGVLLLATLPTMGAQSKIYHKGWIDYNKNGVKDIYEDPTQPTDARVADLLSQMTIEEKAAQCVTLYGYKRVLEDELPTEEWDNRIWKHGIANIDEHLNGLRETEHDYPFRNHPEAINTVQRWFVEQTRLGIPVDFTNEGIHGLNHTKATTLPSPIAIGSTWNRELVYKAGQIVGREGKALGYTNIYAPILDLARDPRWGRVVECYGEDPYLVAQLGINMTRGIQSQGVAATLKHFAVYSVPKGGRDGDVRTNPHVSPREMHEMHLYPFKQVITQAKPMGIMSSYNDYDGVPVTGSYYFLTELLRNEFGFNGYVVSDSDAVEFLYTKHRVSESYKEAVRQVAEAGMNVRTTFTKPEDFAEPLIELVKNGELSEATLNRNVADVLSVKFRLGLFDTPYVADPMAADKIVRAEDTDTFVEQIAREAIVLLKNDNQRLPLDLSKLSNILVTGPLAEDESTFVSRYGPQDLEITTIHEAIREYVGTHATVSFEKGCEVVDSGYPESEDFPTIYSDEERAAIARAVEAAQKSDVIIAVVGEDELRCGECKTRTSLNLPGKQRDLLVALKATGKPIIMVMISGRPLTINWENRELDAILTTWFPGEKSGLAVAQTIFGDNNPSGRLSVTFPKSIGQVEWNFPFKPSSQANMGAGGGPNGFGNTESVGSLYPFGYGLSYSEYEYSNLVVESKTGKTQGSIDVRVTVKNVSQRAGAEVVQLYVRDKVASVVTYDFVMRGFEKIYLEAGESREVQFRLEPKDLEILDENMNWKSEAGEFEIMVGSNSESIKLSQTITLVD
ncbi:MAG: glycoside hydrolase family 3 N-terminal domain-containing protein [Rikenellaceae bacterium]